MGQEYVKSAHEKPMPTHDKAHNKSASGQQQNLFQPKKFQAILVLSSQNRLFLFVNNVKIKDNT